VDHSPKRDTGKKLIENRCGSCGHLMFKSSGLAGTIEKKCEKCGNVNTIKIMPDGRGYQERLNLATK
jgi:phage FluMu protein Com